MVESVVVSWAVVSFFLFLGSVTLRWRIVGRVGSIPTILCFVGFAARVAFKRFACTAAGLNVVFPGLLSFVPFHFPAFRLVMSKFVTIEAVPLSSVLHRVFGLFGFSLRWSWFYFILGYQSHFVGRSKAVKPHFSL